LVGDTRHQRDELSKISTIQFELGNLLAADRASQIGRLDFDLGDSSAFDGYFDFPSFTSTSG
jgi:hypothetical protein